MLVSPLSIKLILPSPLVDEQIDIPQFPLFSIIKSSAFAFTEVILASLLLIWSFPKGAVSPIPTFSELSIVIAVASALSSIPSEVNAPVNVPVVAVNALLLGWLTVPTVLNK